MDYSQIHQDESAHSPWASSPDHSRIGFDSDVPQHEPSSPSDAPRTASGFLQNALESPTSRTSLDQSDIPSPSTTAVSNGSLHQRNTSNEESLEQSVDSVPQPIPQAQATNQQSEQLSSNSKAKSAQRYRGQRQPKADAPRYKLQPKITGLERPNRKELILRFDIHTNLPGYRTTQFRDVRRTHTEFGRFADHLVGANPECMVPALPPSSTPAGAGTDEDETRVKANMQRWMSIVCSNEILMRDEEMMRFIEGDPGYSPVMKRNQPATGVRRKVIKQFAPPPDDTPELMEARPVVKRFYLGTMDAGQKMDRSVKARRSLGLAESSLGQTLGTLTETEPHPGLKLAYRKIGRTLQSTGDLHSIQATTEATVLAEPLHYFSADAFIVKETLTNRHILLRDLLQAQQATRSKLNATDRLKSSSSVRRDKVDEAIAALDEARSHESYLVTKTQRVTQHLMRENSNWTSRTAEDLRASIRELALREIEAERRTLAVLEAVRPDVRAIDASGGLSRLGREATPAARRSALQSSQGPKGDAWSGVPRRGTEGLNRTASGGYVGAIVTSGPGGAGTAESDGEGQENTEPGARKRRVSAASSGKGGATGAQDDDSDRVDARNAASRLATSTF